MQELIANLPLYAAGALAVGFVIGWMLCYVERPVAGAAVLAAAGAATAIATQDEKRRKGFFGWLWRGYRTYDRGAGWFDRIGWLLGLLKTNAAVSVLVLGTGAAVTYNMRHDIFQWWNGLETASLPDVRQTTNSTVFAIDGHDKAGRRGSFDVVVLNKSFLWVVGSSDALEKDGQIIPRHQTASAVLDDEVRAALADTREVIAVGTASQEGNAADETARAQLRAQRAAQLVVNAVPSNVPIWTLNLGQYRDPCTDCESGGTSWQRPFIVIGVKNAEPETNIGEALADAMTGRDRLPSPTSYSTFNLQRYR
ncbi:hypothetical protein [Hyphomicrobium sulfonivorans]|uniref:Uncharacterized protein n=1 Tax=Hyphomicrobium sulfonivorans TaxID=121290 RepID=A0A109B8N2_HYPSL|nr:hypothetical protein [Hyphomicrobium sulfonivorans]KWT64208.1 hypothetical protein APY04_3472 [Hyphomicrobium sulfonivorans]MBI1649936.1 hypothetical protein [Hyphomicrobium sulfonivorans]NSL72853.1 hypothetical protein [Hyphomicrobium sulfonivorans]